MKEQWDLSVLYASEEEFERDLEFAKNEIAEPLAKLEGKLGTEEGFKAYLDLNLKAEKTLSRLAEFTSMRSDLDKKNVPHAEALAKVENLFNVFGQKSAYAEPEILALGKDYIDAFFAKNPEYKQFDFSYEKLFREQDHVLSAKEERLMANFGPLTDAGANFYALLSIADYVPKTAKLSDGREVPVNQSNWTHLAGELKKQEDRQAVFESLYSY